jgi:hypothetical protein
MAFVASPPQVPPPVTPRPSKPARTRNPGQDPPIPPTLSPTYERLRHSIAKRMRMSHVDQPLMLMELLTTCSCYRTISNPAKMESLAARPAEPMNIKRPKS